MRRGSWQKHAVIFCSNLGFSLLGSLRRPPSVCEWNQLPWLAPRQLGELLVCGCMLLLGSEGAPLAAGRWSMCLVHEIRPVNPGCFPHYQPIILHLGIMHLWQLVNFGGFRSSLSLEVHFSCYKTTVTVSHKMPPHSFSEHQGRDTAKPEGAMVFLCRSIELLLSWVSLKWGYIGLCTKSTIFFTASSV